MTITNEQIKKIASLARIKIEENQIEKYQKDLSDILNMIEQLSEVNTENVSEMTSPHEMNLRFREDIVNDGNYADKILSNAPDTEEGYFNVPKVVE